MIVKLLNWLLYRAPAAVVMWRTDWRNFGNEHDLILRAAMRDGLALLRLQNGAWVGVTVWNRRRAA